MAWLGAIFVGLCVGLLGAGGSILNIPILVYVVGENEKAAIAESLAIVGIVAAAAAIPYGRRRLIAWRTVAVFGAPGMVGSYFGAALAEFVPAALQLTFLSIIMVLAAIIMYRPPTWEGNGPPRAYWKIASDGFLVGVFTGLVGVGGGFLIVPTLVVLGGLPMRLAVGTSLVIIALKSLTGYVKYVDVLDTLNIDLNVSIMLLFTALGILGSVLGSHLAPRIPQTQLRQLFSILVVLTGLYVVTQNLPALWS